MKSGWAKQSRHARGYGTAWDKLRLTILSRDHHLCQSCKRKGRLTAGNEVHHRKPKSQGGDDDPSNLETMCHACHLEADAIATGRNLKQQVGADGWPVGGVS